MAGGGDSEVDALESIFGDDLTIIKRDDASTILEMNVQPVENELHSPPTVRVTIEVDTQYPSVSPKVRLWQPRGVDENNVIELNRQIEKFVNDNLDMPILYDIFRRVQQYLEEVQNCPSGVCPICLNDFTAQLPSVRTHCDHYIHQPCFATYIDYSKNEIERELGEWPDDMKNKVDQTLRCPMCREALDEEECSKGDGCEKLGRWEDTNAYEFDWDSWRDTLRKWDVLLSKQRAKGGLIDVDEERHRFLVTDETVVEIPTSSAQVALEYAEQDSELNKVKSYGHHLTSHRRHRNRHPPKRDDTGECVDGRGVIVAESSRISEARRDEIPTGHTSEIIMTIPATRNFNRAAHLQEGGGRRTRIETSPRLPDTSHSRRPYAPPPGFDNVLPYPSPVASTDQSAI